MRAPISAYAWFRFYVADLDDRVLQSLPAESFKFYVNSLCVARKYDGKLPPPYDMAFALRLDAEVVREQCAQLVKAGLFVEAGDHLEPVDWRIRQYRSDVSTPRVRAHRQRAERDARHESDCPF